MGLMATVLVVVVACRVLRAAERRAAYNVLIITSSPWTWHGVLSHLMTCLAGWTRIVAGSRRASHGLNAVRKALLCHVTPAMELAVRGEVRYSPDGLVMASFHVPLLAPIPPVRPALIFSPHQTLHRLAPLQSKKSLHRHQY